MLGTGYKHWCSVIELTQALLVETEVCGANETGAGSLGW